MSEAKYNNWLISLESDNFSMYIKTWFAFLASVHEIVIKTVNSDELEGLKDTRGDKVFLDKYSAEILNGSETTEALDINEFIRKTILDTYI